VEIFNETDPTLDIQEMGAKTSAFLRSRDEGASVSATGGLRVGGNPAFKLKADSSQRSQVALGVLAGSQRYLAIERVEAGAPRALAAEADRVLASFRPR
jgi:hypothetical protein